MTSHDDREPQDLEEKLYDLAYRGDVDGLALLVARHPEIRSMGLGAARTGAVDGGQRLLLRMFLEDDRLFDGVTLLSEVYGEWTELTSLLFERGAYMELRDYRGRTPFLLAADLGKVAFLEALARR